MTTHTPGPWVISRDNRIFSATATEYSRMLGKEVPEWVCATGESAANARLIAAAPDLLSAIEGIISLHGKACSGLPFSENETQDWTNAHYAARAAIRKAKGE